MVKDSKGGYACKHKTELKTKLSSELEAKLVSSNKEHEVDLEWKPSDLNKDGQKVEFELEAKCQPIPNTWSGEVEVKAGGFDLGPITPWSTLRFATNSKQAHSFKYTQNLVYEKEFNLAWQLKLNKDFAVDSAYAYLAMVGGNGNYYLRTQLFKWFVGAGSWWKDQNGNKHSLEVQYDAKDKTAGIAGQPLFLRYGGKYKFGVTDWDASVLVGKSVVLKDTFTFKATDQLKIGVTGVMDIPEIITKGETAGMILGFKAEFKL